MGVRRTETGGDVAIDQAQVEIEGEVAERNRMVTSLPLEKTAMSGSLATALVNCVTMRSKALLGAAGADGVGRACGGSRRRWPARRQAAHPRGLPEGGHDGPPHEPRPEGRVMAGPGPVAAASSASGDP